MTTMTTVLTGGYDDVGVGDPALLCIPGWCGDRDVFADIAPRAAAYRRTVSMDLPEHGSRPRTGADFDTDSVVSDAIAVLDETGIDRVIPVALSHAGWAAIELRRQLGSDRVPGIVLLDWMVLGPPPGFLDALAGLQDPTAWSDTRGRLFAMWTSGLDIPALHAYVATMGNYGASHWSSAGREIATAFGAQGTPLSALERLSEPCPTLHVYAQPADDGFLATQDEYAAKHPWFRAHRLPARSHFPMFEVPDQMTGAIEEFACSLG